MVDLQATRHEMAFVNAELRIRKLLHHAFQKMPTSLLNQANLFWFSAKLTNDTLDTISSF